MIALTELTNVGEFGRDVLAVPSSVGLLRDLAEVQLRKWGAGEPFMSDAMLVISELATNSVAACPGALIGLRMYASYGRLIVEMWDGSRDLPVRRRTAAGDLGGRGLVIVDALAESWGTRRAPGGGKCVWARLRPAAG